MEDLPLVDVLNGEMITGDRDMFYFRSDLMNGVRIFCLVIRLCSQASLTIGLYGKPRCIFLLLRYKSVTRKGNHYFKVVEKP